MMPDCAGNKKARHGSKTMPGVFDASAHLTNFN
jgi:hypothetical protein